MPVIAIAAAAEGVAAIAAGGLTAFETISAVGAIVGGVGALTGNKDMMKIGGVAALAGGMGAFAQGKGWIGDMGDSSNIDIGKNAPAPVTPSDSNPTDMRLADGTQQSPMGADQSGAVDQAIGSDQGGATTGLMNAGAPEADTTAAGAVVNSTPAGTIPKGDWGPDGPSSVKPTSSKGVFDYFKDFGDWADKHKSLASIGANFIGGMFDSKKKAETDAAQAQADYYRQITNNMNSAPNMNIRSSGPVRFPTVAPTYRPVQVGGLYGAKG